LKLIILFTQDKRQISVGVIGYPNTGKSSVINSLMGTKCCKAAPVPGETKIWQYITLMKRIFLIDCPGIVYDTGDDEIETVLKGVVRAERLSDPADFIEPILNRVKSEYIKRRYGVEEWTDHMDFLSKLAFKNGKLMKKGEPDIKSVSVNVINDWQRGKLPFFVAPPKIENDDEDDVEEEEEVGVDAYVEELVC
jgi:nuclear GTP-binding protein